jgi:hypothetical protein
VIYNEDIEENLKNVIVIIPLVIFSITALSSCPYKDKTYKKNDDILLKNNEIEVFTNIKPMKNIENYQYIKRYQYLDEMDIGTLNIGYRTTSNTLFLPYERPDNISSVFKWACDGLIIV